MTKPPHFDVGTPPSAEIIPLKTKRQPAPVLKQVELSEDGEYVDVLDMLYALIEDLEKTPEKDRPTGVFVGMYHDTKDFEHFPYYNHGLTRIELLGVLTQFMRSVI